MKRETLQKMAHRLLEEPFCPDEIKLNSTHFRTQDDCDGNYHSGMNVIIGPDGDAWIGTTCELGSICRYREPFGGGGRSPRVRNALLLLALAIDLDNEAAPFLEKRDGAASSVV